MLKFIKMMITPEKVETPRRFRIQYRKRTYHTSTFSWHLDVWATRRYERVKGSLVNLKDDYVEMCYSDDRQVLVDKVEKILLDEKRTEYFG